MSDGARTTAECIFAIDAELSEVKAMTVCLYQKCSLAQTELTLKHGKTTNASYCYSFDCLNSIMIKFYLDFSHYKGIYL